MSLPRRPKVLYYLKRNLVDELAVWRSRRVFGSFAPLGKSERVTGRANEGVKIGERSNGKWRKTVGANSEKEDSVHQVRCGRVIRCHWTIN